MKCVLVLIFALITVQGEFTRESAAAALKECIGEKDASKFADISGINQLPTDDEEIVKTYECYSRKLNTLDDNGINFKVVESFVSAASKIRYGVTPSDKEVEAALKKCKDELDLSNAVGVRLIKLRNCLLKYGKAEGV